jgi:POT family proton-dependent oligopeptide transporter
MSTPAAERPSAVDRTPAGEISDHRGIAGHPRGLTTLFFTEMWERFSYYGMRALLILFMTASVAEGGLGLSTSVGAAIYGIYTASVYLTAIPGGWIADRLLGQRTAVLYGGILIALGHLSLALNVRPMFYAGLVLIVIGTGLLKTNISSMVGQLYARDDRRRDAGFSIFYMGINLGGFIGALTTAYLGQWIGWHWGFGAAAVGMTLGLIQYVAGGSRLGKAGLLERTPANAALLWTAVVVISLAVVAAFWALWAYRDLLILAGTIVLFIWLLSQAERGVERKRTLAIIVLFVFATLFWAGFEQVGSSLNLFADRATRNSILGVDFPSAVFQSLNSFFIIVFAPVFAWLWIQLRKREPSSPAKFAWGLAFVSVGFLTVATAALIFQQSGGGRVSPFWLTSVFLLFTFGELSLSPVGLSTVTKLAPARLVGTMMGVWFLSIALGNFFGARVAGLFETFPLPKLFGAVALTTGASALVLTLVVKPIRNLMSGVH